MKKNRLLVFFYTGYHKSVISKINLNSVFDQYHITKFDFTFRSSSNFKKLFLSVIVVLRFFYYRVRMMFLDDVSILLPHPDHMIANFFFYSKKTKLIYLYEDGLLNYINSERSKGDVRRQRKRNKLSLLLLYKYRFINGHLTGFRDKSIEGCFCNYPTMLYGRESFKNVYELERFESDSRFSKRNVIFIDQDVESVYGERGGLLRSALYEVISKFDQVYFKGHHDYLECRTPICVPKNFRSIPDHLRHLRAEELIEPLEVGIVISFFSTALVNISREYSGVQCFCFPEKDHTVDTVEGYKNISDLLANLGVLHLDLM